MNNNSSILKSTKNISSPPPLTMGGFVAYFIIDEDSEQNATQVLTWETLATKTGDDPDDSSHYILIPLAVLGIIMLLSGLVYMMARNRRSIVHIYNKRKSKYIYTGNDESDAITVRDGYEDIDDPTECLLKGRLQISNRYENYHTTQVTQLAEENSNEYPT